MVLIAKFLFWRASIKVEVKKIHVEMLMVWLLIFQYLHVLNYNWDSEFKRYLVGKLGALKITQKLNTEIKYLFRQSRTSPNKQHTHSIFWIKYVFLNYLQHSSRAHPATFLNFPNERGKTLGTCHTLKPATQVNF